MPQNTTADFLRTIIPGGTQQFTCPACGVPMSLRNPGSFELNLTVNARKEVNEAIRHFAAYLAYFESEAAARNIPSSTRNDAAPYAHEARDELPKPLFLRGIYSTKGADELRNRWWSRFDHYEFQNRVHQELLPLTDLESRLEAARATASPAAGGRPGRFTAQPMPAAAGSPVEAAEVPFVAALRVLLGGLEPLRLMGHIMSLVYDQPHIRRWLRDTTEPASGGLASGTVRSGRLAELSRQPGIAPALSQYLDLLEIVLTDEVLSARELGPEHTARRTELLSELRRARLTLVLLLGHTSAEVTAAFPGLMEHRVPFTLPHRVVVAPKLLPLLMESAAFTDLSGLRLSPRYRELLNGDGLNGSSGSGADAGEADFIAKYVDILGEDTQSVFTFVCTGPSGRSAQRPAGPSSPLYAPDDPDYCGWFPKTDPTHPVVFIGSPGTSKSTLMLTGLLRFYNNVQALGATVRFQSDKDLREYDRFVDQYWSGALPKPTPAGARNSIQLRVESATDPATGANYVFTDIPGEVTSRSVRGEGADPIVLGVLKHAETVVFLFDLSIEEAVQKQFAFCPANEEWSTLLGNVRSVLDRRFFAQDADNRSRARVSQLDLLERMISDLREIRGHNLQAHGPNFVCIIPKTDLYVGPLTFAEGDPSGQVKFLTGFYEHLIARRLLFLSPNGPKLGDGQEPDNAISWYHSAAGYGLLDSTGALEAEVGGQMRQDTIRRQLGLTREISDEARTALRTIGAALGGTETDPAVRSLSDLVGSRLIDRLESVFRASDVYFLPVSAQGADHPAPESAAGTDGADPGQSATTRRSREAEPDAFRLDYPPNAKLSEYAFMLPVLLSLRELKDRPGASV